MMEDDEAPRRIQYVTNIIGSNVGAISNGEHSRATGEIHSERAPAQRRHPFSVETRRTLEARKARTEASRSAFVARAAEWEDVIHGQGASTGFVERARTDELLTTVRAALLECTDRPRLPAIFVVGAPGAGKSTLVRRVTAILVLADEAVTVAGRFTSPRLDDTDREEWLRALEGLAEVSPRPILLMLDDPFFAQSGWIALLNKLAARTRNIVVFAASPLLAFSEHERELSDHIEHSMFELGRTSASERRALAELHQRDPASFAARKDDDFLVLAMEAAAGKSFDENIDRIWKTLNGDGNSPSKGPPGKLPWRVRAYLMVCYFHRSAVLCPEPLLLCALRGSGDDFSSDEPCYELTRLKDENGWGIFSRSEGSAGHGLFGTSHQLVAAAAWARRPTTASFDPAEWLISASLSVSESATWGVATALSELARVRAARAEPEGPDLARRLAARWTEALRSGRIQLLAYYSRFAALNRAGLARAVPRLAEDLRECALRQTDQSWLALLALLHLSASIEGIDVERVLESADLPLSPIRAKDLYNLLRKNEPEALVAFTRRLSCSMDSGRAPSLLRYLIEDKDQSTKERSLAIALPWLKEHGLDEHAWQLHVAAVRARPSEAALVEGALAWLERHAEHDNGLELLFAILSTRTTGARLFGAIARWLEHAASDVQTPALLRDCLRTGRADATITSHARQWLATNQDYQLAWAFLGPFFRGHVPPSPLEDLAKQWADSQLSDVRFGDFLRLQLSAKKVNERILELTQRWAELHQAEEAVGELLPPLLRRRPREEAFGLARTWLGRHPSNKRATSVLQTLIARESTPGLSLPLVRARLENDRQSPESYDLWNAALKRTNGAPELRDWGESYARNSVNSHADLVIEALLRLDQSTPEQSERYLALAEVWLTANRSERRRYKLLLAMHYRNEEPRRSAIVGELRDWLAENPGHSSWHEVLAHLIRHATAPELVKLGESYVQQEMGPSRYAVIGALVLACRAQRDHLELALQALESSASKYHKEVIIQRDLGIALAHNPETAVGLLGERLSPERRSGVRSALATALVNPHRRPLLNRLLTEYYGKLEFDDAQALLRLLFTDDATAAETTQWLAKKLSDDYGSKEYWHLIRVVLRAIGRAPSMKGLVRVPPFTARVVNDFRRRGRW